MGPPVSNSLSMFFPAFCQAVFISRLSVTMRRFPAFLQKPTADEHVNMMFFTTSLQLPRLSIILCSIFHQLFIIAFYEPDVRPPSF